MAATLMSDYTCIALAVLVLVCLAEADDITQWKTLNGAIPLVIARGGFSGLFPDSSSKSYEWAGLFSLPNVIQWCDVQLTKDGVGICFPNIRLENASNIDLLYVSGKKNYHVNGIATEGWFSVDYSFADLSNVSLTQELFTRPLIFNQNHFPVLTVDNVANQSNPHGIWLNIQHAAFFTSKNLNMSRFVISLLRNTNITYISCTEVRFLKNIHPWIPINTKLIFSFRGESEIEPSMNITYNSLLKNLSIVKEFAHGIIVPKQYIYPLGPDVYIRHATYVVLDAHKIGLEVFSSTFSNDSPYAYDFGYDPIKEYLQFMENGIFSVDGVVSDFPMTPSAAIACYSNIAKDAPTQDKPLVISSKGSSGYYAGCTKAAYLRAISDGVDILDCPVQMTKDGIAICLGSISLSDSTNIAKSNYSRLAEDIPELGHGIFSFRLTWRQIQNLTPSLSSLCLNGTCFPREPKHAKVGTFMTLLDFLVLANRTGSIAGVLINIEHSLYLAEKRNLHVADSVLATLQNVSHSLAAKRVLIQSKDEAVLYKFKEQSYETVFKVSDVRLEAKLLPLSKIRNFANAVVVYKASVYLQEGLYLLGKTDVVERIHGANMSVYVELFQNEYKTQAFDYMLDPYMEINTFSTVSLVDGVITEYPETAAKYKRNKCLGLAGKTPSYMLPALPGGLRQLQNRPKEEDSRPHHKESRSHKAKRIISLIAVTVIIILFSLYLVWNAIQLIQWYFQIQWIPAFNPLEVLLQWWMQLH